MRCWVPSVKEPARTAVVFLIWRYSLHWSRQSSLTWINPALHRWHSSNVTIIFLFKTFSSSNLKKTNACWSWEGANVKINLSKPALFIWSKCLDGRKGSLYIIRFSLCSIHVFTIASWMLKQFIDLENVYHLLGICVCLSFFKWHLFGGFLSALVVTVMFYCSLQQPVCSCHKIKRRTSLATGWKSAGNNAMLMFNWRPVGKHIINNREELWGSIQRLVAQVNNNKGKYKNKLFNEWWNNQNGNKRLKSMFNQQDGHVLFKS